MSGRTGFAAPMFCPYCGEEDIRPAGSKTGDYACSACLRAWNLRMQGSYAPGVDLDAISAGTDQDQPLSAQQGL